VKKESKTHQNAIDFDEKFINHCFQKIKREEDDAAVESPTAPLGYSTSKTNIKLTLLLYKLLLML
jgi:hypothetical protein